VNRKGILYMNKMIILAWSQTKHFRAASPLILMRIRAQTQVIAMARAARPSMTALAPKRSSGLQEIRPPLPIDLLVTVWKVKRLEVKFRLMFSIARPRREKLKERELRPLGSNPCTWYKNTQQNASMKHQRSASLGWPMASTQYRRKIGPPKVEAK